MVSITLVDLRLGILTKRVKRACQIILE